MFTTRGYETSSRIYESERSIVYRAVRLADRRPVVLKVLKALEPPPEAIARFRREYLLTREMAVPGVVEALDHFRGDSHWIIVEEDFGGESLARLPLAGRIEIDRFVRLAIEVAGILAAIHQKLVVHKDINPANIVLCPDTGVVKIIDFGLSTNGLAEETIAFDHPSLLEGTPAYMSPEQTGRINHPLDHRTDLYSLGCTLYHLLVGRPPFAADDILEIVHSHVARAPRPPRDLRPEVPAALSDIVLKLMAKNPDERYQSAHGLEVDLLACLEASSRTERHEDVIELGKADVVSRFRLPGKLYGRDREIAGLLSAFDRVSAGATGLMLVTGYSGIGKSALVKELYRPITERRGFFASGKFEQYERNIPYAPFLEALRALVQQVLCESEARIGRFRDSVAETLGPGSAALAEVIPQLELITGPLPPPPPLPPVDAGARFMRAMRELVRVFARAEHPLVLFLDDLQWSDGASLDLVRSLTTTERVPHLFLIGAYRDNEVDPGHPLSLMLRDVEIAEHLRLAPLAPEDVALLVADAFRAGPQKAATLAALVHEKTGGNPFFLGTLFRSLIAEGLIRFQHRTGTWEWDVESIQARDISDNVVELLIDKLHRLPDDARALLKWAACIGNRFDLRGLRLASDGSARQIVAALMPSVAEGYVVPLTGSYRLFESDVGDLEERLDVKYKFAHDRIQQAAYTLIHIDERAAMHLAIGRRLRREGEADLLSIVGQLDAAADIVEDRTERFEIARLNLQAGDRARESAAAESAYRFFLAGLAFLSPPAAGDDRGGLRLPDAASYSEDYQLSLRLVERATEAAYLTARFDVMAILAENGRAHARGWPDKVEIYVLQINALAAQRKLTAAIDAAREILAPLGVRLPVHPTIEDVEEANRDVVGLLGARSPESLVALPRVDATAPHAAALRILDTIHVLAVMASQSLSPVIAAKMVELTLLYGRRAESINGFLYHAADLCGQGDLERGYQFGQLARAICAEEGLKAQLAEVTSNGYYFIFHWKEPIKSLVEDMTKGYRAAMEAGLASVAMNAFFNTAMAPFIAGAELTELDRYMREIVVVGERLKQGPYVVWLRAYWQCARNLIKEHDDPCALVGEAYDEVEQLRASRANDDDLNVQLVHVLKVLLCYRFGRYREAVASFREHVEGRYPPGGVLLPPTTMYHCLALLALHRGENPIQREAIVLEVREKLSRLQVWAASGPANYGHKAHLVEAELLGVLGDEEKAREHYDKAIDLARVNGYLNEESLALERAGLFFRDRGRLRLAGYYLRDADYAYERWGAKALRDRLRDGHSELLADSARSPRRDNAAANSSRPSSMTGHLPDLDLETVLRASRVISEERDEASLLQHILSICLQHAGARLGFLILARRGELVVKARGVLDEAAEIELVSAALADQEGLSQGIVQYVAKTLEPVVLDDAAERGPFTNDPHIRAAACRSVLCIPILHHGTLAGITYMENSRIAGAFKADRLEVLRLLMAQAAVSIENALLRTADDGAEFRFTVGGSLAADTPSYVLREADREMTRRIQGGELCFVLNTRQMGKSSLRIHAMTTLSRSGWRCAAVDLTSIGSENVTADQWYAGVARSIVSGLDLARQIQLRTWWRDRAMLSPVQRLSELIDDIVLEHVREKVAIFIDEVDMILSVGFPLDDFFGLLRSFYDRRADDPRLGRLTFVLLGVATPADLVRDRTRTPLNIGHAIPLAGFTYAEARVLLRGLAGLGDPEQVLKAILTWTNGQPFLTQKLCQLARQAETRPLPNKERDWVASLVRDRVLERWRVRDEPEHLKTIEARVLRSANRAEMLALYRRVLEQGSVPVEESPLESELLLSGIVTREWGKLRPGNPIYTSVFSSEWLSETAASAAG